MFVSRDYCVEAMSRTQTSLIITDILRPENLKSAYNFMNAGSESAGPAGAIGFCMKYL